MSVLGDVSKRQLMRRASTVSWVGNNTIHARILIYPFLWSFSLSESGICIDVPFVLLLLLLLFSNMRIVALHSPGYSSSRYCYPTRVCEHFCR